MEFSDIIQQRRSIKSYDTEKSISDLELKELFEEVILSPSSFNLQHWTFIAVKDSVRRPVALEVEGTVAKENTIERETERGSFYRHTVQEGKFKHTVSVSVVDKDSEDQ